MFEKTALVDSKNMEFLSNTKHDVLVHSMMNANDVRITDNQYSFPQKRSVQEKIWDGYGWIQTPVPHEQSPPSSNVSVVVSHFERFLRVISGNLEYGKGEGMDGLVIPQRPKNSPPQSSPCIAP